MLVSFSVSNFRSFGNEATLSLVASKRISDHKAHTASIPDSDEEALRVAVLYGANAAGKSNLFKALSYLKRLVQLPSEKGAGTRRVPFSFWDRSSQPTSFDIQFIARDKLYRYGLKLGDDRVIEEWLLQVVGKKEKTLYERAIENDKLVLSLNAAELQTTEKLDALSKVGGLPNQTFLATVAANLDTTDYGDHLGGVLEWFDQLTLIGPNQIYGPLATHLMKDDKLKEFVRDFLKASSTGIDGLHIQKTAITEADLAPYFTGEDAKQVFQYVKGKEVFPLPFDGGSELVVENDEEEKEKYYRLSIQTDHNDESGMSIPFKLSDESDGTRRLLNLLPALYDLKSNEGVYFIDEIDRSLHPILVYGFLDYFLKSCCECRRQVILTTHESNLLDLELLRRDEIWFAEKDPAASTQLYSLVDFKVRNDLSIRKHYLQGRFGAIPFLGGLEGLIENGGQRGKHSTEKEAAES